MLSDEIATYLAGAGLGLVIGTNLFKTPFPATAQAAAVCIVETPAERSLGTFGASLSAPAIERPAFKVISRGALGGAAAARTTADAVYKKLRRLGPVVLSGVSYLNIAAEPPAWLSEDDNGRPRYHFDCRVMKDES